MRLKPTYDPALRYLSVGWLWLMLAGTVLGAPQGSTNYVQMASATDGGGVIGYSTDYAGDGSAGPGDLATSAHYTQRGGYMGQLNNAPVLPPITFSRGSNSVLRLPISAVIASASDPEGDVIKFYAYDPTTEENGAAALLGLKFLQYAAPADYNGNDTIFWTALDSEGDSAQGTILLRLAMPTEGPTLNLISRNVNGAGATLLFAGLPPATEETQVHLQYTDSLTPANWQDLGANTVTNGILMIVDPTGGTTDTRFYRTVYPPAP